MRYGRSVVLYSAFVKFVDGCGKPTYVSCQYYGTTGSNMDYGNIDVDSFWCFHVENPPNFETGMK